jgi:GNAT superfamily N-acetyltransferase
MSDEYEIRELGITDDDVDAIYPIIHQLRDHLDKETFKERYLSLYEGANYRIVALVVDEDIRGAAGFRWIENLYIGSSLYIDDLVTADAWRSKGYGGVLVKHLEGVASSINANAIRLDSAIHREDAHRFYERNGFEFTSKHFMRVLNDNAL